MPEVWSLSLVAHPAALQLILLVRISQLAEQALH
jgi:hypothetical protein